jgi:hypothetical protein
MSEATQARPYSWLIALIVIMTAVTFAFGAIALHYIETSMIARSGATLALTAVEVTDKLDRCLVERYGDVQVVAGTFSAPPNHLGFQSAYLARMKMAYSDYLWIGATNLRGEAVVATDQATVGRAFSAEPGFQAVRKWQMVHAGDVILNQGLIGLDAIDCTVPITSPPGEFFGAVTVRVGTLALENLLARTIQDSKQCEGLGGVLKDRFLTRNGVTFIDSSHQEKAYINLKQAGLPFELLSDQSPQWTMLHDCVKAFSGTGGVVPASR